MRVALPGLRQPRPFRALLGSTDDALARMLVALAHDLRAVPEEALAALAHDAGLPLAEVLASPFGLRMIALGVAEGASTVPHETRAVLPWAPVIAPPDVARDPAHGRWENGVLRLGKYQHFCADAPRSAYHPEQHAKWAPHELLHRAMRSFWRPGASRFELYLGARLNELLPVATWYGIEHALRLDDRGPFDREAQGAALAAELSRARWRVAPRDELEQRAHEAAPLFREGLVHAARELDAIARAARTGTLAPVRHAHAYLDAASDAVAYVAAHAARLGSGPFSRVLGALRVPADRFDDVGAYLRFVEGRLDALLFAPVALRAPGHAARRARRRAWDLAHRAALLGDGLAHGVRRRLAGFAKVTTGEDARALHAALLEDPAGARIAMDGEHPDLAQLEAGLRSAAPRTASLLGPKRRSIVARLAGGPHLLDRAPLGVRLARQLADEGELALSELARFEGAIAASSRGDDRIERLAEPTLPRGASLGASRFARNEALRVLRFEHDPVALHRGEPSEAGPTAALVGRVHGEVVVVGIAPALADRLAALPATFEGRALAEGKGARQLLTELAAAGAIAPIGPAHTHERGPGRAHRSAPSRRRP